jgi:hypothetical protein
MGVFSADNGKITNGGDEWWKFPFLDQNSGSTSDWFTQKHLSLDFD